MSITGIQGQILEVTVVGCSRLKDTEWISRQDPYVCLEYASTKFRTKTCTDGGKNPTFQEKFVFSLIEGLREIIVGVWNSNTLTFDDHIGSGKVQLQKVLSEGFDDFAWPLQTKTGRHAGEVKLVLHFAKAKKPASSYAPSAPYMSQPNAQVLQYSAPPAAFYPPLASAPSYPPPVSAVSYPPPHATAYPPSSAYPSYSSAYPPPSYPPPPGAYPPPPGAYPPHPYQPPSAYHSPPYPPPSAYAPCNHGPYPGVYPPPPY